MARRRCKRVAASLSEGDVEGHCDGDAGGSHRLGARRSGCRARAREQTETKPDPCAAVTSWGLPFLEGCNGLSLQSLGGWA